MRKPIQYCKNLGQSLLYKQAGRLKRRRLVGDLHNVDKILVHLYYLEEEPSGGKVSHQWMSKAIGLPANHIRIAFYTLDKIGYVKYMPDRGWFINPDQSLKSILSAGDSMFFGTTEEIYQPIDSNILLMSKAILTFPSKAEAQIMVDGLQKMVNNMPD